MLKVIPPGPRQRTDVEAPEGDDFDPYVSDRATWGIGIGCALLFLVILVALGFARKDIALVFLAASLFGATILWFDFKYPMRSVHWIGLTDVLAATMLCSAIWTGGFFLEMVVLPAVESQDLVTHDREILQQLMKRQTESLKNWSV